MKIKASCEANESREFWKSIVGTGLYYYGARYYDPKTSIWQSVDPLAEHSPGKTPYHYCSNNPINRTDPTGMCDDPNCTHGAIRRGWDSVGRFFGLWGHGKSNSTAKPNVVTAGPIEEKQWPTLSQDNSTPEQRAENEAKYNENQSAIEAVNNHDNIGSPQTQLSVMKGVADGMPQLLPLGVIGKGSKAITAIEEIKVISQFSTSTIDDAVIYAMNNKAVHVFGKAAHNLDPLVAKLGGQENTFRAVLNAANGKLPSAGIFSNVPVNVGGYNVIIRGNVINGVPKIGTMFIP